MEINSIVQLEWSWSIWDCGNVADQFHEIYSAGTSGFLGLRRRGNGSHGNWRIPWSS